MKHTLVITSTVHVNSNFVTLKDPNIRLQQYIDSILFYLKSTKIGSIIVCDNSGFDYAKNKELESAILNCGKEVELLNFIGNSDIIFTQGKGYGEGEIMKFVLENSILINKNSSFLKVTGRIFIKNIDIILKKIDATYPYFQRKNMNPFINTKEVSSLFYSSPVNIFKNYLLTSYEQVNDNTKMYLEHVYYQALNDAHIKYKNFEIYPFCIGTSGSTGLLYSDNLVRHSIKHYLNIVLKALSIWS